MRATVMNCAGDVSFWGDDLDGVKEGYRATNERGAIKVMVTFP